MSAGPLSISAVVAALGPALARFDVEAIEACDSTNSRVLARAEAGAPAGLVIAAERQTAGRGRLGRAWFSAPGDSLTFSLLWRFPRGADLSGLSLAVGVALAEALAAAGEADIALKWPNDILSSGLKVGGILIELATGPGSTAAAIGIGLNIRLPESMPPELRRNAAALARSDDRNLLLARLLTALLPVLEVFAASGFAALRERWRHLNAYAGLPVQVLSPGREPVIGRCVDVDLDGTLRVETAAGICRILSGDVSLRPA